MRVSRIYTNQALAANSTLELDAEQSHYLGRVLRVKSGQPLILFNGSGGCYEASILQVSKKAVSVQIGQFIDEDNESPLNIELAIALSKGDKMDWVVQKACELGVFAIQPLFSERCDVKLNTERQAKRLQHWQQVAISACEQCVRNTVPTIKPIAPLEQWVKTAEAELKLVLHHRANDMSNIAAPKTVCLLIGPEGGLSASEIALAEQQGFQSLALGPRVLRTETAPLAAISALQYRWGDFSF